ncbi:MAG: hypothetical protein AAGB06_04950 [Verrucomicrobiota bacterium]
MMSRVYSAQRSYTSSPQLASEWIELISGIIAEFEEPPECHFTLNTLRSPALFRSTHQDLFASYLESESESITHIRIELSERPAPGKSPLMNQYARLDAKARKAGDLSKHLHFYTRAISKSSLFRIEEKFLEYSGSNRKRPNVTYGQPCEVMAAMVDLQGFSAFCEQSGIESPYTCAVVGAFYQTAEHSFESFPPDVLKIQGDGILMIWKTTAENRALIAQIIQKGVARLDARWKALIKDPQFHHGAPSGLKTGVSFGLASSLPDQADFLGRPINMASRISDQCNTEEILLDENLPGVKNLRYTTQKTIQLKGIGRRSVWSLPIKNLEHPRPESKRPGGSKFPLPNFLNFRSKMAPR